MTRDQKINDLIQRARGLVRVVERTTRDHDMHDEHEQIVWDASLVLPFVDELLASVQDELFRDLPKTVHLALVRSAKRGETHR